MINLLRFECKKIVRQKLLVSGAGIITFFTVLSSLGFIMHRIKNAKKTFQGEMIAELMNGIMFSMACLVPAIYILLPMIVAIFTAVNFAGEYQNGQLRTTLLRPVSKWHVYFSKFAVMSLFSAFLLLCLLILSYASGAIMFGASGDIIIFGQLFFGGSKKMHILNEGDAWLRLAMIYSFAVYSMVYLVAMFMMFSSLTKKVSHTIVISLGVYYTSYILLSIPFMRHIRDYLPTRYLAVWRYAVMSDIPWDRFRHDSLIDLAYIIGFLLIGGIIFSMSDV
jgi:ABC-type transport system involved in multi-copper enzyme maturation permease subunit